MAGFDEFADQVRRGEGARLTADKRGHPCQRFAPEHGIQRRVVDAGDNTA